MKDKEIAEGEDGGLVYLLRIDETKLSDSGTWRCELSNSAGKASAPCTVKILEEGSSEDKAPEIITPLKNMSVMEDGQVLFQCKTTGFPKPDITWSRNGKTLASDKRHVMASDGGLLTLHVTDVSDIDAGVYKLEVSNVAGRANCDARLTVKQLSMALGRKKLDYSITDLVDRRSVTDDGITEGDYLSSGLCDNNTIRKFLLNWKVDQTLGFPVHLKSKCAVEGTPAVLNCLVAGVPPFKVRWFKDNDEIYDGSKFYFKSRGGMLTLEIPSVSSKDTGNYMCEVRNTQGKIYSSCYLQAEPVFQISKTELKKPLFTKPMKRLTVDRGEVIRFRVTAEGNPPPGFKWYKDSLELHDNARISTEVTSYGVAQLTIEQANVRDIGLYTCEAHNQAGRAKSMVRLSVRDEFTPLDVTAGRRLADSSDNQRIVNGGPHVDNTPEAEYTPQQFSEVFKRAPVFNLQLPSNQGIMARGRLLLECCVNGFPQPQVQWLKDGKVLAEDGHVTILRLGDWHGLEIVETDESDVGVYSVQAEYPDGVVESTCTVDTRLPVAEPKENAFPSEVVESLARDNEEVVQQTESETDEMCLPGLTPSVHLCNTEPSHSERVEEVELKDLCEAPHFIQSLPDQLSPRETDADVTLECEIGGHPCPVVAWFKDEEPVQTSDRVSVDWSEETRKALVQIKKPSPSDTGRYTCMADSGVGGQVASSTVLHVIERNSEDFPEGPHFTKLLPDQLTPQDTDKDVTMECKVGGHPCPAVTWLKDGSPLRTSDRVAIQWDEEARAARVQIKRPMVSDTGRYTCSAQSDAGEKAATSAVVFVRASGKAKGFQKPGLPEFKVKLGDKTSPPGAAVQFECVTAGTPPPKVNWFKKNKPIQATKDKYILKSSADGFHTLQILDVTEADVDTYKCEAITKKGSNATMASLIIKGKTNQIQKEALPEFKVKLCDKKSVPDVAVQFECITGGVPRPTVKWFKNDTFIEETNDKYEMMSSVDGFHTLLISSVTEADADTYKCEATNKKGSAATSAQLTVKEVTEEQEGEPSRPVFIAPLHSAIATPGHEVVLKCVAKGNPQPKFKWQRDVLDVSKSGRFKVEVNGGQTTLTIQDARIEDAGLYYCTAQNKLGIVKSCGAIKVLGGEKGDRRLTWSGEMEGTDEQMLADLQKRYGSQDDTAKLSRVTLYEDEGFEGLDQKSTNTESEPVEAVPEPSLPVVQEAEELTEVSEKTEDGKKKTSGDEEKKESKKTTGDEVKAESTKKTCGDEVKEDDKKNTSGDEEKEKSKKKASGDEVKEESKGQSDKGQKDTSATKNENEQKGDTKKNEAKVQEGVKDVTKDTTAPQKGGEEKDMTKDGAGNSTAADDMSQKEDTKPVDDASVDSKSKEVTDEKESGALEQATEEPESLGKDGCEKGKVNPADDGPIVTPRFTARPRSQWVVEKGPLVLSATVQSVGGLSVVWYKDGEMVEDCRCKMYSRQGR